MKNLIMLLSIFIFGSCTRNNQLRETNITERILYTDKTMYHMIFVVDNHEYLGGYQSGIVHLESCQCKQIK